MPLGKINTAMSDLKKSIDKIKATMKAYATDGRTDEQPEEYREAYIDLHVLLEDQEYENPNPYRTLETFYKDCGGSYAERRELVESLYADLLFDLGRKNRKQKEPRNWSSANHVLNDELSPVRTQWLKAKNFIYAPNPDFENSIKESISSVESCLMILLKKPNGTLGKLIKSADLDPDIREVISKTYGFISNKDFIRHGGTVEQKIGSAEAEFFLEFAATSIIYITQKIKIKET
mgnify:CR=1 FL=1